MDPVKAAANNSQQQTAPTPRELVTQWVGEAAQLYREAKTFLAEGSFSDAMRHIALGEEKFLAADQLRIALDSEARA